MFKEIVCAVAVLVLLNYATQYIQKLIKQSAELEEQVLFLTVKVGELRELNSKLQVETEEYRYEAAAAQRSLGMHVPKTARRRFTRPEWEVGSEAWQALSEGEQDNIINMMAKGSENTDM
jgi:hypothetical protein